MDSNAGIGAIERAGRSSETSGSESRRVWSGSTAVQPLRPIIAISRSTFTHEERLDSGRITRHPEVGSNRPNWQS